MEIIITFKDGKSYKMANGTYYSRMTSDEIINVIETAKRNRTRLVLDYGDVLTGKSWNEVYDITGRIGRSTGSIKIPILLHNSRSIGGGAILDHCIIKISESRGKKVLYKHPKYDLANIWK
jgi:hypothetical protein